VNPHVPDIWAPNKVKCLYAVYYSPKLFYHYSFAPNMSGENTGGAQRETREG